jgi:hypothetical protein
MRFDQTSRLEAVDKGMVASMDVYLIVMLGLGFIVTVTYVVAILRVERQRKRGKSSLGGRQTL